MFDIITRFENARILVVDDSVFERRLISIALKKSGFAKIETADDGAEALLKTIEFRPDLVLLDLNMPNLDGFGYCEKVRNDSELPRMPIIVQTSYGDRASRLRALSCGADDYLTKPLDMEELSLRISSHVERYFMLREMEEMCGYLRMELDLAHGLRVRMEQEGLSASDLDHLGRHYEVLEQIVGLPSIHI